MSRRRNNQRTCGSGHDIRRSAKEPGARPEATKKDGMGIEELSHGIDMEAAGAGLAIADLFKTLALAAVQLPNMELYSDLISVVVDDDSITVSVSGLGKTDGIKHSGKAGTSRRHCCGEPDPGYEEDSYYPDKDDEEERVYDGD